MDLYFIFTDGSAIGGSVSLVYSNGLIKLIPLAFLHIKVKVEQSTFSISSKA